MTAGTGVAHSEFNPSKTDPVHLLQIWIHPEQIGLAPSYEEKTFDPESKRGRLRLIASADASDGSLKIHQDAKVYASIVDQETELEHPFDDRRKGWIQVARGAVTLNGTPLKAGDGAAIEGEKILTITGNEPESEFLLFDLPTA